jgi:hypothetical protein
MGTVPRIPIGGDPDAMSAASGMSSYSLPPEPCNRTSGGLIGSVAGMNRWLWDVVDIDEQWHRLEMNSRHRRKSQDDPRLGIIPSSWRNTRLVGLRHARKANLYGLPIRDKIGATILFARCYANRTSSDTLTSLPVIEANCHRCIL